ncbi:reverse transcriptase domain-containing protein [Tanacetum coccineum]
MQKEKEQQDKLKAVKAHLLYGDESRRDPRNHEESHYSESKTPTARTGQRRRHGRLEEKNKAHLHVLSVITRVPKQREPRCKQGSIIIGAHHPKKPADIRRMKTAREGTGNRNQGGTGQTPRKMTSLSLGRVKTYDGNGDPKDHIKLFQSAAKTERVWFYKLPKESIDSYEDLRAAFRENYLQQTKHIKDPVEIHHIKQRDGESMEDFMKRYKTEVLDVEGAPECMKISGFMHGITHRELIKRLYERILRSMDEMYRVTTSFLQGEVAAFSHGRKKAPTPWKQPEGGNKPNFKKGFKNKQRLDRKPDRFSLLTKTPKEIFALEKGKFKAPPPMVTPAEKRDPNKYCEFHVDTGHSTDECMQLRKQIDEMIKSGKLSQFIKELKQNDDEDERTKLDQFTQFRFHSLTEEEGWNRIDEYVQYQEDLWDAPPPSMNISSISKSMQPPLKGRLKKACKQISFHEAPTREIGLKNPYLICDYCKGPHEADECEQNNPSEQVYLFGGDIYNDPSLLRFYQNDDTSP